MNTRHSNLFSWSLFFLTTDFLGVINVRATVRSIIFYVILKNNLNSSYSKLGLVLIPYECRDLCKPRKLKTINLVVEQCGQSNSVWKWTNPMFHIGRYRMYSRDACWIPYNRSLFLTDTSDLPVTDGFTCVGNEKCREYEEYWN